jgi:hypothetical protein
MEQQRPQLDVRKLDAAAWAARSASRAKRASPGVREPDAEPLGRDVLEQVRLVEDHEVVLREDREVARALGPRPRSAMYSAWLTSTTSAA